jgi:transcriptional regulator of met regulon
MPGIYMLQIGDEICYDISWFIFSCTSIGNIYYEHIAPYIERLPFDMVHSIRTGFTYTLPVTVVDIIGYDTTNKMVVLKVYLPNIEICERAFHMFTCKKLEEDDWYYIKVPYEQHCIKNRLLCKEQQNFMKHNAKLTYEKIELLESIS